MLGGGSNTLRESNGLDWSRDCDTVGGVMLDTVKLRSPYLSDELAAAIERRLVLRRAIDGPTGEVLYELVSGALVGSFDHRVSVTVLREEWVSERSSKRLNPRWQEASPGDRRHLRKWVQPVHTYKQESLPFIELEGSVHKALLGHNVHGGPGDVLAACRWFVADVGRRLGVQLPAADGWEVRRADWAEVYDLGTVVGCAEYVRGLNAAEYPRRKVARYADESISAPGTTTAVKVYRKGPEFSAHDGRRFRKAGLWDMAAELQEVASTRLRVEIGVKARKLDEDFGGRAPLVAEVTAEYLRGLYEVEVVRLLREGAGEMRIVRLAHEVEGRLAEVYGERCGGALYATWVRFSTNGEGRTKERMKRATFYLHRKQLQAVGISWHGTDVALLPRYSAIPADFAPVLSDPRRVGGEDPRVIELLAPYRLRAVA